MKITPHKFKLQSHVLVAIAAWGSKIITAGVQVIIMRYLINYLGVDEYGAFAVCASLASWLALTDCGFGTSFQNALSVCRASNLAYERLLIQSRLIQYLLFFSWIPILLAISAPLSSFLFGNIHLKGNGLTEVVILVSVVCMINAVASIAFKILYALQLGVLANIYPAIGSIFSLIAIICLIKFNISGDKLFLTMLAYCAPLALVSIVANVHIHTNCRLSLALLGADLKKTTISAWQFFGFSLLVAGVTGVDYLIMAQILSATNITRYSVISKIFTFTYFLYYSVLTALWPVFTELMTLKRYAEVKKHIAKALTLGLLIILIGTGTFIYFRNGISKVLTDSKVFISVQSVVFFGLYYLLRVWGDAFAVVIASVNKVRIFYVYMPLQAIISAAAQYYLGQKFGIDGVIAGTALSFIVTAAWINPLFVRNIFNGK